LYDSEDCIVDRIGEESDLDAVKPERNIENRDEGDRGEDGPGALEVEGGGKDRDGNCAEERQQIVSQMLNGDIKSNTYLHVWNEYAE
jgi:hypothetical protein